VGLYWLTELHTSINRSPETSLARKKIHTRIPKTVHLQSSWLWNFYSSPQTLQIYHKANQTNKLKDVLLVKIHRGYWNVEEGLRPKTVQTICYIFFPWSDVLKIQLKLRLLGLTRATGSERRPTIYLTHRRPAEVDWQSTDHWNLEMIALVPLFSTNDVKTSCPAWSIKGPRPSK